MRNHNLFVGEFVFDCAKMLAGHIVDIITNADGDTDIEICAADEWNKKYMDLDAEEEPERWFAEEDGVYQFADGKVDHNGYPVCYEHLKTTQDYPYYSPVVDENMFAIEVWDEEDFNNQ